MVRYYLFSIFLFFLFVAPQFSFAVSYDQFDSYSATQVNTATANIWRGGTNIKIDTSQRRSLPNSFACESSTCGHSSTSLDFSGEVLVHSFWIYVTDINNSYEFEPANGATVNTTWAFWPTLDTSITGQFCMNGNGEIECVPKFSANTWTKITIEYDFADMQARAKWENATTTPGTYTAYVPIEFFSGFDISSLDIWDLNLDGGAGDSVYIDDWGGGAAFSGTTTAGSYTNTIYSIVSPDAGDVITSTPTNFIFSYIVSSSSVYDTAKFDIYRSDGSLFTSQSESIPYYNSTAQMTRFGNVEYGQYYRWRPCLVNSTTGSTTCGVLNSFTWIPFSVLNEDDYQALVQSNLFSSTSASSSSPGAFGLSFASSSLFGEFTDRLSGKFPFAYATDMYDLFFIFRSGLLTPPPSISATSSIFNTTTPIVAFDVTTFRSTMPALTPWIDYVRYFEALILWFLTGWWTLKLINKLF